MNTTPKKPNTKQASLEIANNEDILQKSEDSKQINSLQEIIGPLIDEVKLM